MSAERATRFRLSELLEDHAGWGLLATAPLVLVLAGLDRGSLALHFGIGLIAALFLIVLFTRSLENDARVRAMFRAAYLFGALALVGSVLPFMVLDEPFFLGARLDARARSETCVDCDGARQQDFVPTAIAVLVGCPFPDPKQSTAGDPAESLPQPVPAKAAKDALRCGGILPQWIVSVGGAIPRCAVTGKCRACEGTGCEDALELADLARTADKNAASARSAAEKAVKEALAARDLYVDGRGGETARTAYLKGREKANEAESKAAKLERAAVAARKRAEAAKPGSTLAESLGGNLVFGGLVVPLYFLVLALLGASVSLVRKLPEFQLRALPSYREEFLKQPEANRDPKKNPIPPAEAREFVIFQVVQVATALPIAFLAYAWAKPDDLAEAAVLGFAAGFSSELFLMAIRGVVDRAIGVGLRKPLTQIDSGLVSGLEKARPKPAGAPPKSLASGPPSNIRVGAPVQLAQRIGIFLPGSRGVIREVTPAGELVVQIERAHTGEPMTSLLSAYDVSFFAEPSADLAPEPGQATG